MAPSRYSDKALACDLIIITSPYTPKNVYDKIFSFATVDGFDQLDRQISVTIEMTEIEIHAVSYNSKSKGYEEIKGTTRTNNLSGAASTASKPDAVAMFNSIFA